MKAFVICAFNKSREEKFDKGIKLVRHQWKMKCYFKILYSLEISLIFRIVFNFLFFFKFIYNKITKKKTIFFFLKGLE